MAFHTMKCHFSYKRKEAEPALLKQDNLRFTILEKNQRCIVVYVFTEKTLFTSVCICILNRNSTMKTLHFNPKWIRKDFGASEKLN